MTSSATSEVPPDDSARRVVVKATAGADSPERCSQALTVAATAAVSGAVVSLWLTGEATWLAVPTRPAFDLPHSAPPAELLATVLDAGAVTVCTACAARRAITEDDLLPGVRIAGSASFVAEILQVGTTALVY